jgi:hypothetical protein
MLRTTIDLNILYADNGYTALSDSNQAKFLKLYHYTRTHSTSTAITNKEHPLTEWDIAKLLRPLPILLTPSTILEIGLTK